MGARQIFACGRPGSKDPHRRYRKFSLLLFISNTILKQRGHWIQKKDNVGFSYFFSLFFFITKFFSFVKVVLKSFVPFYLSINIISEYFFIFSCSLLFVPIFVIVNVVFHLFKWQKCFLFFCLFEKFAGIVIILFLISNIFFVVVQQSYSEHLASNIQPFLTLNI